MVYFALKLYYFDEAMSNLNKLDHIKQRFHKKFFHWQNLGEKIAKYKTLVSYETLKHFLKMVYFALKLYYFDEAMSNLNKLDHIKQRFHKKFFHWQNLGEKIAKYKTLVSYETLKHFLKMVYFALKLYYFDEAMSNLNKLDQIKQRFHKKFFHWQNLGEKSA